MRALLAIAVSAVVITMTATSATAVVQGGRTAAGGAELLGTGVQITATAAFNPTSGHCVAASLLMADPTYDRQVEEGLLRCGGTFMADGTCPGGQMFVETEYGYGTAASDVYTCYPQSAFVNNTAYTFSIHRTSTSSTTFTARIGSTNLQGMSGFGYGPTLVPATWMEWNNGTTCSGWGPASAAFRNWQRFKSDGSVLYATGADKYNQPITCFTEGAVNATGGYDVSK